MASGVNCKENIEIPQSTQKPKLMNTSARVTMFLR